MSYNTRIKLKSDTESNWLSQDPVLLDGEVAIVKCDGGITRKKIGDGTKKFSALLYDESKTLGITSASVGQIPKVKSVDSNGAPTEWESITMESVAVPTATASTAGTIKVGKGLSISDDGTLSVTTAAYYTGTSDPVNALGVDGDLYLQTEG